MTFIEVKSDLTVVGGGIAGISASLAAARRGLKVALVEARDVLGGNNSSEYRVHLSSPALSSPSFYARDGGISDELKLTVFHHNPRYNTKDDYHLTDMALFSVVLAEPNIDLYLGAAVTEVETDGNGVITKVIATRARTEETIIFSSPLYADGSGDGVVAFRSDAEFRTGREAREEYGESLAPDVADNGAMGSCILFTTGKADHPIPFVKPPFAYDYKKDGILAYCERPETGRSLPRNLDGVTGIWWLSYGGILDAVKDDDKIDLELKRLVYGFWDHVKNSGEYEGVENYYLKWVGSHLAKRESRRFIGDYVLNQNDIVNQTDFYDGVCTGGWSLDIHDPEGVYGKDSTSKFGAVHGLYNIPYRIMYSKDVKNLFLLGRIVSATHVALGSLRVMQTLGSMAEAVGCAAYLCKKYSIIPSAVSSAERIEELRDMLQADGVYISGRKENLGFTEGAAIIASSEKRFENTDCDIPLPLNGGVTLALPAVGKVLGRVKIRVSNSSSENAELSLKVYSAYKNDSYELGDFAKEIRLNINGRFDGYVELCPECDLTCEVALLVFGDSDKLSLCSSDQHMTGAPLFTLGKNSRLNRLMRRVGREVVYPSVAFKELSGSEELYSAKNIASGISRPVGIPHLWAAPISDKPTLEIVPKDPTDITELHIRMNPSSQYDHFDLPVRTLIRNYEIEIEHEAGVYTELIEDNYLSDRVHRITLKGVRRVKLKFLETYGHSNCEIFAVKLF